MGRDFVYIDNVTVYRHNHADHNRNLKQFMAAIEEYNLTLNNDECFTSVDTINFQGYTLSKGSMSLDPK